MATSTAATATRSRRRSSSPEVAARFADGVQDARPRWSPASRRPASAEIRRDLAGPLAVDVVTRALELARRRTAAVLGWYDEIVAAVDASRSAARSVRPREAVGGGARSHVGAHDRCGGRASSPRRPRRSAGRDRLERRRDAVRRHRDQRRHDDDALLAPPDEPRPARRRPGRPVARRRTRSRNRCASSRPPDASIAMRRRTSTSAGAAIRRGDLVIVSLTAANRDPATFPEPDTFDICAAGRPGPPGVRPGSPRVRRASTWPGSRRWPRSTPRSTAGPACGSRRRDAPAGRDLPQASRAAGPLG